MQIISQSVKDTLNLGRLLAGQLQAGDIICLEGELGSGKTVFTKGIAEGLGVDKTKVTSSSFILIRRHLEGRVPLYHFDLYRLKDPGDIAAVGYEEYFYDEGVAVIEWAQNLDYLMPKEYLMVELSYRGKNKRMLKFSASAARYKKIIQGIK
ncbi:MAG: tRNA (adenosine(37)-N6)-threonylcarbamoyltransferase complex ATPase subunit type 1 TsaE [Candidatus Omnitrophica bacterium]|nr:tRNA (adenosine(37)-N6)-threonylcarbamoyltransferase complex ATPase subunit type 1 TsaE [Candidatus Omnitrophota bacterium]MDD5027478.1 tRNA (adenosine(37)-N6)-threonylcarbamoyltransferase complex ATPase subunit type 1 TsaE [Candidatus Omnitrophota bacterium]MDD5662406.1 tRNA (adenosine(37)-N6)-threonylcarbamoyltransferase complex ATPase subunit type 1 TsaE [Candidatus Omnitrophota bacterium]